VKSIWSDGFETRETAFVKFGVRMNENFWEKGKCGSDDLLERSA